VFGLHLLDIGVILVYLLGITAIGVWTYKKVRDTGSYFLGGRKFGKILTIAHSFGAGTHTDQPVSVAGAAYEVGMAGIWYQFMWLFTTPFYWLLAPVFRRMRYITTGDFFEQRYDKTLGALYALIGLLFFSLYIGIMLKGTAVTVEAITGGAITSMTCISVMTIMFVIYGVAGGLIAAAVTDAIQGVFIVILSFLLLPFAINAVGGFSALHNQLPDFMFNLVAPREVTAFFLVMMVINGLVGIVVQPQHMAICSSGKTELNCRVGWTFGNFIKRFCTIGWAYVGLCAAVLFPNLVHENREMVFGLLVTNLLPSGLIGLMVASMLAAVMSTCDAFMVNGSALFTRNFYQRFIKQDQSEAHYLQVARTASAVIVIGGLFFAFTLPSVVRGLLIALKMTAFLGISFWLGIIWRRANCYGAWSSFLVSSGLWLIMINWDSIMKVFVNLNIISGRSNFFSPDFVFGDALEMLIYLSAGFMTMIFVSLCTKPEPNEKLNKFFSLLHAPVGEEKKLRAAGIDMIYEGE
jgi:Na+/proline symporter